MSVRDGRGKQGKHGDAGNPGRRGKAASEVRAFRNDEEVLACALAMLRVREEAAPATRFHAAPRGSEPATAARQARESARVWHARLAATPASVPLAALFRRHRLCRVDREIVVTLLLDTMGVLPFRVRDVSEIVQALALDPASALAVHRAVSEGGRLFRKGILYHANPEEEMRERQLVLGGDVVELTLHGRGARSAFSGVGREAELHEALAPLTRIMQRKSDDLEYALRGQSAADFEKHRRRLREMLRQLHEFLDRRPQWKLSAARDAFECGPDWIVALALLGKALLHARHSESLFTGGGLGRAACERPEQYRNLLRRFLSDAPLLRDGIIQPCGGEGTLLSESPESLEEVEFELSNRGRDLLGLEASARQAARMDAALREPRVALDSIALPPSAKASIRMAVDHVRHSRRLLDDWGLREAFPYGTGVTLLFHGPPGTGKTATAEAIARELGRPFLVADYAKIQNCFVGQTEKNIVSTFQKARQAGAVLLWDEADAMFFDRDAASRTWEVRDVNVLLQEIERFEGVCILATNRKTTLDKALERRITAKIAFPRPDRPTREILWRKLLPPRLPLAPDVDFAELAKADLSGGEVKNVLLNAARMACGRGGAAAVSMRDLVHAMDQERRDAWSGSARRPLGFLVDAPADARGEATRRRRA